MVLVSGFPVAVLVVVGLVVLDRAMPPRARDIAWLVGSGTVPDDEADVVRRYLGRHRRHRTIGGLFGVLMAGVAEARVHDSVSLPVLLFGCLAGVLVGALSAESYRLTARAAASGVASLEPREPAPLPGVVRNARVLLAVSALVAIAVRLGAGLTWPLWLVAGGVVISALAEVTRARIVGRRRPVLSFRAAELDARIRAFAGRSVAHLELAAALLVAAGVVASPAGDGQLLGLLRFVLVAGAFVWALVSLHGAAPRPPYSWRQPS